MIHVKDYGALEPVQPNRRSPSPLLEQLRTMIGKQITVFIDSGDCNNNHFTGILIQIFSDRISLITSLPPRPGSRGCRSTGTQCQIMLEHISAISFNYL